MGISVEATAHTCEPYELRPKWHQPGIFCSLYVDLVMRPLQAFLKTFMVSLNIDSVIEFPFWNKWGQLTLTIRMYTFSETAIKALMLAKSRQ
jgi:hypothetical protein